MKHVVISGGSGGLGTAIAGKFRREGWTVDALSRTDLDLRDPAAISRFFENRPLDLLVCAAGITRDAPLAKISETTWDETFYLNFTAAKLCAEAVLPHFSARQQGHIVFVSSQSALHPPAGQAAYSAAKAALLGLTTELAARHGPESIRANCILPGFLETPMTATVSEARRAEILRSHHLGRFNTPAAVADFLHFLHENLPQTSGQIFRLDSRS